MVTISPSIMYKSLIYSVCLAHYALKFPYFQAKVTVWQENVNYHSNWYVTFSNCFLLYQLQTHLRKWCLGVWFLISDWKCYKNCSLNFIFKISNKYLFSDLGSPWKASRVTIQLGYLKRNCSGGKIFHMLNIKYPGCTPC